MKSLAPFLAGLALGTACAPPTCASACERVVDECGLGTDVATCEDACKAVKGKAHDTRDCLAVADCGEIAGGKCTRDATACGPYAYYVVDSLECMDGPAALEIDGDCGHATSGDFGALGPVTAVSTAAGASNVTFQGDCTVTLPSTDATCTHGDGTTCDVTVLAVF